MGIKDNKKEWDRFLNDLSRIRDNATVAVGIQGDTAAEQRDGGISNAHLAATHEFGVEFRHPGGTAYLPPEGGEGVKFVSNKGAEEYYDREGTTLPRTRPHNIKIPERSFLRSTIDANTKKYQELIQKLIDRVLKGGVTVDQALNLLGMRVAADCKNSISKGIAPANKPATVRAKGSSKPLVDTGQLKNSITWSVRHGDKVVSQSPAGGKGKGKKGKGA